MQFDYLKSSTDKSHREFLALNNPNTNYFGLDISELEDDEVAEVVFGLAQFDKKIAEAMAERTKWVKEKGYDTYYRYFNPSKMKNMKSEKLD